MAEKRVEREIAEVAKDKLMEAQQMKVVLPDPSNLMYLTAQIPGPPETPFEGGKFDLEINVPSGYPFSPPVVKFVTKIWHPNISSVTGTICLDILKDQWAAAMTLRTVMLSIQALLTAAEPDDPQDAVVARQYKANRAMYDQTARHWSTAYAGAPAGVTGGLDYDGMIAQCMDMGFDADQARAALSAKDWEVEAAVAYLLT